MPKRRNVMRKFKIDEISAVDRPAQVGATAVLMKRDDEEADRELAKMHGDRRAALTSPVNNHSHLIPLEDYEGNPVRSGLTSYSNDHDHPFVVQEDGTIVIGEARGHTHEVAAVSKQGTDDSTREDDDMSGDSTTAGKGGDKGQGDEALKNRVAEAEAKAQRLEKVAALNDAEKAHLGKLEKAGDTEAVEAWLGKSAEERAAELRELEKSDEVVYKAADGTEFRKSDDPRLVKMAKQADENAKLAKRQAEELEQERLEKRADEEIANMPGETKVRAALLKAVDGIEDEENRKGAHEALKAGDRALKFAFNTLGDRSLPEGVVEDDVEKAGGGDKAAAEAELEKRANELAKNEDISFHQAYTKVLETEEGGKLYKRAVGEA